MQAHPADCKTPPRPNGSRENRDFLRWVSGSGPTCRSRYDFITALPASVLRIYRKLHSLTELPIELSVHPPVAVVTLRHRTPAPTAQSFIQCARDIATSFAGKRDVKPRAP